MEGEREEFTRRYWPQIDSYCKRKGLQFVPVDMRWGITTESSANKQTINICLREIDRSDIFVGFYGQVLINSFLPFHLIYARMTSWLENAGIEYYLIMFFSLK